jgi:integrase/recombinase XerC
VAKPAGAAALVLVHYAVPLHPEESLFEAMLEGWRRQHAARRLSPTITAQRQRMVRRFTEFTGLWPWEWRAENLDTWVAQGRWAHSTVRNYQGSIAQFMDYLCDPRYGWKTECEQRVGEVPVQICQEENRAVHVSDYEGRPERRPLTRVELQTLFDTADAAVEDALRSPRKGWLSAFRDATLLKVIYAWGLRRTEASMLDVCDFSENPAAPELGGFGMLAVRYGKAMRGSPPKRRSVASVMPWASEVIDQYVNEVRPLHGAPARGPALWLTERGTRISSRRIDERFAEWRATAELPSELSVHCLRHSYASHLVEDGVDPLFVQHQLGHSWASTTAIYTTVGADHTNAMLRSALDRAFSKEGSV